MSTPKNILIIRLSAMGDIAMIVPVILALIHQYPDLKISLLTKPFYGNLFKDLQYVSIIPAEVKTKHKGLKGLYRLSQELKNFKFDAVADLHDVLRSKILRFFLFWHGLKIKSINKGRAEKKALTRTKNKKFKPLKPTTQRYVDVFKKLGFRIDLSTPQYLPKTDLNHKITNDLNFLKAEKHIGIAPFAAHDGKTYPADLMQNVIEKLAQKKATNIYLFGGGELEMSRLHNWALPHPNVYCVAGKYDFKIELDLIANLDLMLSMDSGNGHLAAMYGVSVITLWGQTHPHAGFAPFQQEKKNQILANRNQYPLLPTSIYGNKKIPGYEKVMRSISPEVVVDRVNTLLD